MIVTVGPAFDFAMVLCFGLDGFLDCNNRNLMKGLALPATFHPIGDKHNYIKVLSNEKIF
jgi:hypothetical protein